MSRFSLLLLVILAGSYQGASAQPPGFGMGMGMGMGAGPMDARFYETAPKVGDLVQDLDIFDDQGNPVNIREIATGQYTVLVLGCLT